MAKKFGGRWYFLQHSVPITALGNWDLFDQTEDYPLLAQQNTASSSNLVFPGGPPIKY